MIGGKEQQTEPIACVEEIERALTLFVEPGGVVEVRALEVVTPDYRRPHTVSGYFNDLGQAARAAASVAAAARGVYFTPNAVEPALLARAANRLRPCGAGGGATSDEDVTRRRWLLIDFDPVRPSGISASEEEHQAALERAREVARALGEEGWPEPIVADSGNGAHLAYRIDLPNDDASRGLIEQALKALAARFDTPQVRVDPKTFNAARIWKLYGTTARKGDPLPERPHRRARLLSVPAEVAIVAAERLEAVAGAPNSRGLEPPNPPAPFPEARHNGRAASPKPPLPRTDAPAVRPYRSGTDAPAVRPYRSGVLRPFPLGKGAGGLGTPLDLDAFIARHGLDVDGPRPWKGGRRWVFRSCPFGETHAGRPAYLVQHASGAIVVGCLSCGRSGNRWRELRARYEPPEARASAEAASPGTNGTKAPIGGSGAEFVPVPGVGEEERLVPGAERAGTDGTNATAPERRTRWMAPELCREVFHDPRWAVPDLIPEGVTLLCGAPKVGKSWLCLQIAIAVAAGGRVLGRIEVEPGGVLYAALEDTPRRLQRRLRKLLAGEPAPNDLEIWTEMDRVGEGGQESLEAWLEAHPTARLVLLDTLARVRPRRKSQGNLYTEDYEAVAHLKTLADAFGLAVVVVHHSRKAEAEDPQDRVSGTQGLAGAADATLMLLREARGPLLYGRGRDVEEFEWALTFDPKSCLWSVQGTPAEARISTERQAVLTLLRTADGPMSATRLAELLEKKGDSVRPLLSEMVKSGLLIRPERGLYALRVPPTEEPPPQAGGMVPLVPPPDAGGTNLSSSPTPGTGTNSAPEPPIGALVPLVPGDATSDPSTSLGTGAALEALTFPNEP